MYIKNLEIDNFKSFANKAEIPLLKGFTTVSGPNGSGKSNIIDSVLFALGLANAGELRAENLSHFISTYNKRNEAFVKVTFGDVDEGGDLSISRKIRKNSQGFASTYYINDTVSSLTNVHSILEKYNVTPNSYNVMMQGDVMWITECTSRNRRKIIDEIAGVAEFDRRIEQSTEQLNTVEQRVERASLILSEVEKSLERLKEEREVALKYQALRDEKQKYESQVTKVRFFDLKRSLEQAHLNILDATKKKKEEEILDKDLEEKLKNLRKEYEDLDNQVKEKGGAEQLDLKRKEETIKGDIERKNHAIDYAEKQIQDGLKVIANDNNAIANNNQKIDDFNLKIQLKEDEIKIIQDNIKEKEDELKKINEDMTGLSDSSNLQIENRNKKRKELEALKDSEYDILQKKLPLETELKNLTELVEKSKTELKELQNSKENFNSDYDLKQTLVKQLEAELQDFKNIQQKTRDDLEITKNEISDCEYKISIARKKVTSMETKKELAKDFMGQAIDTVMRAKLKGVHAPLAQLGSVDKEYSTAVEVAFGNRMAHIVVDNEHVASVAIELLHSENAGRATFIPLNKIKPAPTKLQLPKDKGVIDYAINLVDFDDKYIDAFYYAVGDTLVVEDIDCANKFIGKYRMVTLNGELYEKSGSITGGTLKKTGLSFSQNEDDELEKCTKGLKDLEAKYAELIRKRDELDQKTDKLRSQYADAAEEHSKAKLELSNMKNNFDNNEKYLSEKEDIIKNGEPHIKELNKKLDKLEEENVKIYDKITVLEDEIKEIEKLIDDTDLKELKEKTAGVEAEIKRLQGRLMSATGEKDDFNRQIEFFKSVITSKKEEIEKTENTNKTLEDDKVRYKEDIKNFEKDLEVLKEKIKKIESVLGELITKRDDLNNGLIKLEKEKVLKESDIERISEQIESFKARRRELEPLLEEAKTELENSGEKINELEPVNMSIEDITNKIQRLEKRMSDMGDVNMRAIATYEANQTRQKELKEQIDTLSTERKEILEKMGGYEQLKKETFMKTYNNINENFKEVFHTLSEGEGELVLETPDDPLSGGLDMKVSIREKKHQRLAGLSGGEKSITALAFVFAIQRYMPSPFYAFDEVDANLDTMNVERIAEMVRKQAKDTQFIVVSHRKPMIESANRTIGVTQKEKGKSKVTGVKLRDD